jgi:hypothetical protein
VVLLFAAVAAAQAPVQVPVSDYPLTAVPFTDVRLTDSFWRPRLDINRTVTVPHILRQNEVTGRVDNFLKAARKMTGEGPAARASARARKAPASSSRRRT